MRCVFFLDAIITLIYRCKTNCSVTIMSYHKTFSQELTPPPPNFVQQKQEISLQIKSKKTNLILSLCNWLEELAENTAQLK